MKTARLSLLALLISHLPALADEAKTLQEVTVTASSDAIEERQAAVTQKTVINRACKLLIRSSDDSILYDKEDKDLDPVAEGVKAEVKQKANAQEITFDQAEVISSIPQTEQPKPNPEPIAVSSGQGTLLDPNPGF